MRAANIVNGTISVGLTMSVFPTTADNIYSAFHIRDDVRKFLQVRSQEDVGISHDWPRGIELCGDHEKLSRKKQDPREDCNIGKLGSIAAQKVLGQLRHAYWLSSHLHTKYAAIVEHETRAMKNSTPIDDIGALQKDKKVVDAEEVEDNTSVTIEFYSPNVTVHCL
jgi:hypothetical protein